MRSSKHTQDVCAGQGGVCCWMSPAARGQQPSPRQALLSLVAFPATKNKKQGQEYEQAESDWDLEMWDVCVVFFSFSLRDLSGDALEGSWLSYCPASALFSSWIIRELQSGPFHQHWTTLKTKPVRVIIRSISIFNTQFSSDTRK